MKAYFAHPINVYNTALENFLFEIINSLFCGEVENPNQPKHAAGYQRLKTEAGNGMLYYTQEVLPNCKVCVFLAFRDGKIGAGVFKEIEFIFNRHGSIYEILPTGRLMAVADIEVLKGRILSVDETKQRVYADGATRPY